MIETNKSKIKGECDILFIPEYIYRALLANNISLTDIDQVYYGGGNDVNKIIAVNNLLRKAISKEDIYDLSTINNVLYNLFIFIMYSNNDSKYVKTTELLKDSLDKGNNEFNRFNNFLATHTNSIIMSDESVMNTIDIIVSDNVVFIILKNNFANIITHNNKNISTLLIRHILNTLFKYKPSSVIYRSLIFKTYLKLTTLLK